MNQLTDLQKNLKEFFSNMRILLEEPLKDHTSFRIGGPAEAMAFPATVEELSELLKWAKQMDIHPAILGAGTNVLASDEGRRGLTICTRGALEGLQRLDDTHVKAMAGVSMGSLAVFAAGCGLGGLEFAHGIPGSVGGGLYMNAGAYGGEMKQVAIRTEYLDMEGNLHSLEGEAQEFSYRHSAFTGKDVIIVSGTFALTPDNETEIRARMADLMNRRKTSQPLDKPSAGSTFKRPVGGYAAALIDQAGLKGYQIGGAAVSTKHAGFVVNLGGATEKDVLELIEHIKARVKETSGIELEPEVVRLK